MAMTSPATSETVTPSSTVLVPIFRSRSRTWQRREAATVGRDEQIPLEPQLVRPDAEPRSVGERSGKHRLIVDEHGPRPRDVHHPPTGGALHELRVPGQDLRIGKHDVARDARADHDAVAVELEVDARAVAGIAPPEHGGHDDRIDAQSLARPLEATHLARIDPTDGARDGGDRIQQVERSGAVRARPRTRRDRSADRRSPRARRPDRTTLPSRAARRTATGASRRARASPRSPRRDRSRSSQGAVASGERPLLGLVECPDVERLDAEPDDVLGTRIGRPLGLRDHNSASTSPVVEYTACTSSSVSLSFFATAWSVVSDVSSFEITIGAALSLPSVRTYFRK